MNKLGNVHSEFRTFKMEILAKEEEEDGGGEMKEGEEFLVNINHIGAKLEVYLF